MKRLLRVLSVLVLLHDHLGFSKLTESDRISETSFSVAKLLNSININASVCVIIVVFPSSDFSTANATVELNIKDLDKYPVVLIRSLNGGMYLKDTNRIFVTEGCRVLIDLSKEHLGHIAPSDIEKQGIRVFTYEIEFHRPASPLSFNRFIKDYAHNMETTIRPYARILIVISNDSEHLLFLYCLSCESNCIPIMEDTHPNIIASPRDLTKHCVLKSHGQNLFAYVQSDGSIRRDIQKPRTDCEYANFRYVKPNIRCTFGEVMVRLIARHLNVTFQVDNSVRKELPLIGDFSDEEDFAEDVDPNPGLVMCAEICYMSVDYHLEGRAVGSLIYDDKSYALYCNEFQVLGDPSWLDIFDLCDIYTWIGIIVSALLAGLISWNKRYCMDVVFILMGQQPQCNWRRDGKDLLLGTFIFTLMILNQDYLSTLTNQVTAPLERTRILSIQELFASGYKFVFPSMEVQLYFGSLLESRYRKLGMGNKTLHDYSDISSKLDLTDGVESYWFGQMVAYKWIIPGPSKDYQLLEAGNIFKQNRLLNFSCYIVRDDESDEDDQHLFKRDTWYFFRGRMRDKAYWLIQRMHHAAIYNFWRADRDRAELRASRIKQTCWSEPEVCSDDSMFQPLKWNSRFKIVMYWHLVFCAGGYILFLWEKFKDNDSKGVARGMKEGVGSVQLSVGKVRKKGDAIRNLIMVTSNLPLNNSVVPAEWEYVTAHN